MQGEPEFERLKRELEEVKNAPRGLEGTFRTAAEMERHRAQLADAAIEEQLEVQTAFREHGARLQGIYEKRQRTDVEMARREQEMKQLHGAPVFCKPSELEPVDMFYQGSSLLHVFQSQQLAILLGVFLPPVRLIKTAAVINEFPRKGCIPPIF
jgi:hypothetical protein